MAAAEPLPVPLRAPRHYPLRAHLPDHPDEILVQVAALIHQVLLAKSEKLDLAHAQQFGSLLLLRPADVGDLSAGNVGIEAAASPVG